MKHIVNVTVCIVAFIAGFFAIDFARGFFGK